MSRRDVLIPIIPLAPPCFSDRLTWVEFVVSGDEATRVGERGPLDLRKTEPRFNHRWNFCADCLATHALAMQAQGRCNPQHLRNLTPVQETTKC